jgi:transcriptional regulator with XRE-family HTH domain
VTFNERFADNLIRCRQNAGLSQEALAVRATLSLNAVSKYERGEIGPTIDTLIRLAGALSVPARDLLDGLRWNPAFVGTGPGQYRFSDSDGAGPQDSAD